MESPGKGGRRPRSCVAVPTADVNLEAAFLGAVMVRAKDHLHLVAQMQTSDFFEFHHQLVFSAIKELVERGRHVDAIAVNSVLEERGEADRVGGIEGIIALQSKVVSLRHSADYAERLKGLAQRRRAAAAAAQLQADIQAGAAFAASVDLFLSDLSAVTGSHVVTAVDAVELLRSDLACDGPSHVIPSGLVDLDQILHGGLRPGQLLIVGARPSMGKSAFGLGWAYEAAKSGTRVLFVTAEMSAAEQTVRLIARISGVSLAVLAEPWRMDGPTRGRTDDAMEVTRSLPFTFLDASVTVGAIRAEVMTAAAAGRPYELVVVDYLQLLDGGEGAENRNLEVARISRGLKVLAREMSLSVIALSQLSRAVERRSTPRPGLADLRDSGSLEQDADIVLLLYRPEIYDRADKPGTIEIDVAKHRNGATGTVRAFFGAERAEIRSLAKRARAKAPAPKEMQ